jgi:hypothetical protein
MARYCPSCGTRLNPTAAYTPDDFESALADVLDAPVEDPVGESAISPPEASEPVANEPAATAYPVQSSEWTARASDWAEPTGQPGTWAQQIPTATTAPLSRRGRTKWILLAIFGFLVFCCCGLIFVALLIDGTTSAATSDVSLVHLMSRM